MSNWTKTIPTVAGAWQWRKNEARPIFIGIVREGWFETGPDCWLIDEMGGEWSKLYTADEVAERDAKCRAEVKKAAQEAAEAFISPETDTYWEEWWPKSRACRVSLGQEESIL